MELLAVCFRVTRRSSEKDWRQWSGRSSTILARSGGNPNRNKRMQFFCLCFNDLNYFMLGYCSSFLLFSMILSNLGWVVGLIQTWLHQITRLVEMCLNLPNQGHFRPWTWYMKGRSHWAIIMDEIQSDAWVVFNADKFKEGMNYREA